MLTYKKVLNTIIFLTVRISIGLRRHLIFIFLVCYVILVSRCIYNLILKILCWLFAFHDGCLSYTAGRVQCSSLPLLSQRRRCHKHGKYKVCFCKHVGSVLLDKKKEYVGGFCTITLRLKKIKVYKQTLLTIKRNSCSSCRYYYVV